VVNGPKKSQNVSIGDSALTVLEELSTNIGDQLRDLGRTGISLKEDVVEVQG
jgi:hypothetical protein